MPEMGRLDNLWVSDYLLLLVRYAIRDKQLLFHA